MAFLRLPLAALVGIYLCGVFSHPRLAMSARAADGGFGAPRDRNWEAMVDVLFSSLAAGKS